MPFPNRQTRPNDMAKRLPRPTKPVRPRCEIEDAEQQQLEELAAQCRLSLTSFIRVVLVESAAHPERLDAWRGVADRLRQVPEGRRAPGRPKKDGGGPKPPRPKK